MKIKIINKNTAKKILTLFLFCNLLFIALPLTTFATHDPANPNHCTVMINAETDKRCVSDAGLKAVWEEVKAGTGRGGAAVVGAGADALIWTAKNAIGPLLKWIIAGLFSFLGMLLEYVLLIVGYAVDNILYYTVLDYKNIFYDLGGAGGEGKQNFIYQLWAFIRDILNTLVFFVIMYHAILSMIDGFEEIKNKFIYLVVFALLINFSLAFVKGVIDVSNVVTLTIYQSAVPNVTNASLAGTGGFASADTKIEQANSFTSYIIKQLNPAERWKKKVGDINNNAAGQTTATPNGEAAVMSSAMFQVGYFIALAYLIYLFILIGSTFLVRSVAFIAAMVMSPFIVASIFFGGEGKFKSAADTVKGTLIDYSLRGPAYMLTALLSASLAKAMFATGTGNGAFNFDLNVLQTSMLALKEIIMPIANAQAAPSLGPIQTEFQMILRFLVFIAFFEMLKRLFDSIIDGFSAGAIMKGWSGKLTKGAFRTGAFAGRLTGGNLGKLLVGTDENTRFLGIGPRLGRLAPGAILSKMQQTTGFKTIGRSVGWLGNKAYKGTWDVANLPGAEKLSGYGIDLGKGSKIKANEQGKKILEAYGNLTLPFIKSKLEVAGNTGKGRELSPTEISTREAEKHRANKISSNEEITTTLGAQIDKIQTLNNKKIETEVGKIRDSDIAYIAQGKISDETLAKIKGVMASGIAAEIGGMHFTQQSASQVVDIQELKNKAETEVQGLIAQKAKAEQAVAEMKAKDTKSIKEELASEKNEKVKKRIESNVKDVKTAAEKPSFVEKVVVSSIGTGSGVAWRDVEKARKKATGEAVSDLSKTENEKKYKAANQRDLFEDSFDITSELNEFTDLNGEFMKNMNEQFKNKIAESTENAKKAMDVATSKMKDIASKGDKANMTEFEKIYGEVLATKKNYASAINSAIRESSFNETEGRAVRSKMRELRERLRKFETVGQPLFVHSAQSSAKATASASYKPDPKPAPTPKKDNH
jgi:hypothetical protein